MQAVREILSSLTSPLGLPRNIKLTPSEITKWEKEKKPNLAQKISVLLVSSIGLALASAGIGFLSFKENHEFGKLLSGIGMAASVSGIAADMFFRNRNSNDPPLSFADNQDTKNPKEITKFPEIFFRQRTPYYPTSNGDLNHERGDDDSTLRYYRGRLFNLSNQKYWLN